MAVQPIPDNVLDDRLGFVGTAGSGKTYNSMGRVERLLAKRARVVIPDPLGVWWGLRLQDDGKTESSYNVVIFGGPHGDLPLNEHAGALIGETVAGMAESCIIDLSQLGTKAAERRFMLAFLTSLYRHANREPVHIVFDEADMWAPQRLLDKEGDAAKLLGMMETIVRRGRIKGFIPWLITQRPAVLSKDVLSQIDGLIAFKLTSSQDRDAIGDWVQGQADKKAWGEIWAQLATMERGQGVVWIPAQGILETVRFPAKRTFDSSRTPKRGETVRTAELKPLDLPALRDRMAQVVAETKANDPSELKKEIARLRKELAAKPVTVSAPVVDQRVIEQARREGRAEGERAAQDAMNNALGRRDNLIGEAIEKAAAQIDKILAEPIKIASLTYKSTPAPVAQRIGHPVPDRKAGGSSPSGRAIAHEGVNGPQQRILDALAWWEAVGVVQPSRTQVAVIARYSPSGGAFQNPLGGLRSAGLVDYPSQGSVSLTDAGRAKANSPGEPPTVEELHRRLQGILNGPQWRILAPLIEAYPDELSRDELAAKAGYEPNGGAFQNPLGSLRSLGLIDYPGAGRVVALPILFLEGR